MFKRILGSLGLLALCAASGFTAAAQGVPEGYPSHYARVIEASKHEGDVLIYSNVAEYNWQHILKGFYRKYPWIKVSTLDLGPSEAFERYYSERAARKPTADAIVTGAADAWQRFIERGEADTYASPERAQLPEWSLPFPGLYTISADPMIIVYNKLLLREEQRPKSLARLGELVQGSPRKFKGKVTTFNASAHAFAYTVHWAALDRKGSAGWETLGRLAPFTRPEAGGSAMFDKVTAGEYLVGFYVSSVSSFPKFADKKRGEVVGWSLVEDGTPVVVRGMAVTKGATNPSSARLLLDYILSHEGQLAVSQGGMTPYRPSVKESEVPFLTYAGIVRRIGESNVIRSDYKKGIVDQYEAFQDRWAELFKAGR